MDSEAENEAMGETQRLVLDGYCCSCHLGPPCSFCCSMTEEEADAYADDGVAGLERLWGRTGECPACDGAGSTCCQICDGSGEGPADGTWCGGCRGEGEVRCPACAEGQAR